MAAPITNEPYAEQTSRAFHALKFASPQQLAQAAQAAQSNPQSPEALGLAAATNFQQQQRAAGVQAPQQTVYQRQIAQLLQSMQPPPVPMQGGLAGIGPNVYAAQEAAAMDPMRNAGIGIAPENMPEPQGAATGGLVALAQGGEVPGYAFGKEVVLPESGTAMYPEEEEESDDEAVDLELENETGQANPTLNAIQNTPKMRVPREDGEDVHRPAPGSSAAREANKRTTQAIRTAAEDLMEAYGPSYAMSPELAGDIQGQIKEAGRDKWINALAQGIGGMLSAQTPYFGQAAGQGLLAGAAGYQQGTKEERDLQKQLFGLKYAAEKERHADRRSSVESVLAQQAATLKAQRQRELEEMKANTKGRYGLAVANILAGRAGAGNMVDPNERSRLIDNEARQIARSAQALQEGWTPERVRAEAERRIDSELQRAPAALRGVNPAAMQNYNFIVGGPLGNLGN